MKTLVGSLMVLAVCLAVVAQDKPAEKKGHEGHEPPGMQMPKPAPEMEKLIRQFAGTWSTHEKHEPNPMMPKGGEGSGSTTFRAGPGGNSLIEDYKSQSAMGTFQGHGVVWWDAQAGGYRSVWCDTMTPRCDVSKGVVKWQGDTMVSDPEEMDMGGQKMVMRGTYSEIKPGSFTFAMDVGPSVAQLKRGMTIHYTKKTAAAKKPAEPMKQ